MVFLINLLVIITIQINIKSTKTQGKFFLEDLCRTSFSLVILYINLCVFMIINFFSFKVKNKFQLLGAAAMRLASKMEEYQAFDAKEWSYLTGDSCSPRQILKMEQIILKVLGFNMKSPTICDFIQHLSSEYKMDDKTIHLALVSTKCKIY